MTSSMVGYASISLGYEVVKYDAESLMFNIVSEL